MEYQPLVSVVVPVYNVEAYMETCVDSILAQTYKNLEIILVDDGAEDRSGLICDGYEAKDSRVKVIHKPNGGLSDARNKGIERASGEYITFVDSDDILSEDCVMELLSCARNEQAEIVQGVITSSFDLLGTKEEGNTIRYESPHDVMCDYLLFRNLVGYACNKLYDIRLFKELRYPVGKIQEDAWVTYKALYEASRVVVIPNRTYYYRVNNESIMNGSFRPQRFDIMMVPDSIRDYLSGAGDPYDYSAELNYYTMRIGFKTYNDCIAKKKAGENKKKMRDLRNILTGLPRDRKLWGRKYVYMQELLSRAPAAYHYFILFMRKKKKGTT